MLVAVDTPLHCLQGLYRPRLGDWVLEGSLAGHFRIGVPGMFGQTWPRDPSRSTGLALQFNVYEKSGPVAVQCCRGCCKLLSGVL